MALGPVPGTGGNAADTETKSCPPTVWSSGADRPGAAAHLEQETVGCGGWGRRGLEEPVSHTWGCVPAVSREATCLPAPQIPLL